MNSCTKISLGTAQWGMEYGWANKTGQPTIDALGEMLATAQLNGLRYLDCAQGYGAAENILGKLGAAKKYGFKISTKLGELSKCDSCASIINKFNDSRIALKVKKIDCLMVHSANDLLGSKGSLIWDSFLHLMEKGLVGAIGVSIYHPSELEKLINLENLDIVQLPFNIYDQRFLSLGWLEELKKRNIIVQARSIFLQGILTLDSNKLPLHLEALRPTQENLISCLQEAGFKPLEAAMQFCLYQEYIDQIVVGCESLVQLDEILNIYKDNSLIDTIDWSQFAQTNMNIINPSNWPEKPSIYK